MSNVMVDLGALIASKQEESVLSASVLSGELVIHAVPVSYTHLTLPTKA